MKRGLYGIREEGERYCNYVLSRLNGLSLIVNTLFTPTFYLSPRHIVRSLAGLSHSFAWRLLMVCSFHMSARRSLLPKLLELGD